MLDKLPSYIFIATKCQLSRAKWSKYLPEHADICLSLFLSFILVPTVLIVLVLSMLYRKLVEITLKLRNPQFRHFVQGVETLCCTQDCCTPSLFIFVDYPYSPELLTQRFVEFMQKCTQPRHQKIFFSWSSFMGYHYFYSNAMEAKDYVTLAKDNGHVIRTKADFSELIAKFDTAPMPDNNNALFHIIVYPNAIQLPNVEHTRLVCFKMHHSLGDGKAILSWMMTDLADNGKGNVEQANGQSGVKKTDQKSAKPMQKVMKYADALRWMKTTVCEDKIKSFPNDFQDHNILSGTDLKQEKYICWFNDNSLNYMTKIQQIRKMRQGCTFLDVLNTCIASSLEEYFAKHTTNIPETIGAGVVLSPVLYSFQYDDPKYTLSNEFSVGGFFLPVRMGSKDLLSKLHICEKEYQMMKECIDVKFNYWLSDIASILPYQVSAFMSRFTHLTAGISSIPGISTKFTVFGGHPVKDSIMMPPNSPGTALHFAITSYAKQLCISLTIDKSVVQEFSQGQSIVDGIVDKIDDLHTIVMAK